MAGNSGQVRDYHAFPDDELPEGWCRSTLGNLSELVSGAGFPIKYQGRTGLRYPFFKVGNLGDVNSGELLTETPDTIDNVIINELHAKIIPTNSIVFAKIGMAIRLNRRRMVGVPCCIDNNMMAAVPNGAALPHYLLRFLETVDFMALTQATTVPSIRKGDFESISIPLPPIPEQKRIVAKVEELLARVNSAKERLAKVSMILKRFRQVVLTAACSGRLTADWRAPKVDIEPADQLVKRIRGKYREQYEAECSKAKRQGKRLPKKPEVLELRKVETAVLPELPDEWTWIYLPALGYLSRGKSKHRPRNAPYLYGGPYPFIQTGDIAQSRGLITSHQQTYSEAGLAQSHLWPSGTICITIAANIANSAILTYPACFPDSVVGLVADKNLCLKEYVEFFIRTARANLDQFAPATAQKNINIEILSDLAVPLPPIIKQKEIVRRVESLFKLADAVEKRVGMVTVRAEKLTQAILAKAFRGELVPTEAELARREGRSYESASDLLARIKSEIDAKQTSQKVRRNRN